MKIYRDPILVLLVVGLFAALSSNANAQSFEQKARVTFSQPVEVPGLVLPAGSYVFETLNSFAHLTRILSADEMHVYTTVFTMPEERLEPAVKATVTLAESPNGEPERVQGWFYPGESTGNWFIYTKPHQRG
jgi:hypothetical protein